MLELVSSGLLSVWLNMVGIHASAQDVFTLIAGPGIPGLALAGEPDQIAETILKQYIKDLTAKGNPEKGQGIWIQSGPLVLASNQGTVPLPAASLTKIATSLAALRTWGPFHQFETLVSATGPIKEGVLQGDLIIVGGGDPMFVWEEAIALGNALNKIGIKRVSGNLIIAGKFSMNFQPAPGISGQLLKEAFNAKSWGTEAQFVYSTLPAGTPKPEIAIAGGVKILTKGSVANKILLLRRRSLPLAEILRQMNIYSNNEIAEMLAEGVGGAQAVKQIAAAAAQVPPEEILLINGSGLGQENRISPRAACAMYIAIQRYLLPYHLTIADLFPVSGRDGGTLDYRQIPKDTTIKTGTLADVSALAGALPTRERGLIYFAIINRGYDIDGFRLQQDILLQRLQKQWGAAPQTPFAITARPINDPLFSSLGAANRNEILFGG